MTPNDEPLRREAAVEHGSFYRFAAVEEPRRAWVDWLRALAGRLELLGNDSSGEPDGDWRLDRARRFDAASR